MIQLRTINTVLDWVGLVLVVQVPTEPGELIAFEMMTRQGYDQRCATQRAKKSGK